MWTSRASPPIGKTNGRWVYPTSEEAEYAAGFCELYAKALKNALASPAPAVSFTSANRAEWLPAKLYQAAARFKEHHLRGRAALAIEAILGEMKLGNEIEHLIAMSGAPTTAAQMSG